MALCDTCRRFDLYTILLASGEEHEESSLCKSEYYWYEPARILCFRQSDNIYNVKQSASTGCKLCGIILTAFERKGAEAYNIASDFPIVLHKGQESKIRASFITPEEPLITICDLDVSISNREFTLDMPF